jgi:hypothetical protein
MHNGKSVDVSVDYQGNVVEANGQGGTGTAVRGSAGR